MNGILAWGKCGLSLSVFLRSKYSWDAPTFPGHGEVKKHAMRTIKPWSVPYLLMALTRYAPESGNSIHATAP